MVTIWWMGIGAWVVDMVEEEEGEEEEDGCVVGI
jgi:hypothetical protein